MYLNPNKRPSGAYGELRHQEVPGFLELPDNLLPDFLAYNGFVNLTIEDGVVTAITGNDEAYQAWIASLPEPTPPQPTELALTQLAVAELAETEEQHDLENKLAIAELAETVLGGEA